MSFRCETIHISLGSTANAVSAHLLNLQGLAATGSSTLSPLYNNNNNNNNSVPPEITHAIHQDVYVPRCIFVQEGDALEFYKQHHHDDDDNEDSPTAPAITTATAAAVLANDARKTNPYRQAATQLAYAKHSRYRAPKSRANTYYSTSSNKRHVDWDEEDDEEEEQEEEEEEQDRQRRQERELYQWQTETMAPLQKTLEEYWTSDTTTDVMAQKQEEGNSKGLETEAPEQQVNETMPVLDYTSFFAPPLPPNYQCSLPFSSQSNMVDTWDSYTTASLQLSRSSDWCEHVLFEKLRKILEQSNGVQGITIATEGHGVYAGLTTSLLEELQDECRTAGRLVLHVTDPPDRTVLPKDSWQPAHVRSVRNHIESGLALFDFGQTSHAIVPVRVASSSTTTMESKALFQRTSQIAMAWETATLAYRSNSALMASGYGDTPSRLTVREFLASLQPSERYKMLELDYYDGSYNDLALQPGTSVERRVQQQNRESQSRQVLPGGWMETSLTPLSPNDGSNNRSLHHHWSLTSSIRRNTNSSATTSKDDLTCFMEGMGIRFRPESCLGVVVNQSFSELISGGYAAGAYWKANPHQAIVAVLSNSTRTYDYVKKVANDMKDNLTLLKYKGYHNRDVVNGILPDREDCFEAMEYCLGLRDTYHPPEGSGLGDDEEGSYFDDI